MALVISGLVEVYAAQARHTFESVDAARSSGSAWAGRRAQCAYHVYFMCANFTSNNGRFSLSTRALCFAIQIQV